MVTNYAHTVEYGVRRYGGHVEPMPSMHIAKREAERLQAVERNVWVVERRVGDWGRAPESYQPEEPLGTEKPFDPWPRPDPDWP